jgi:hypothetical protein
MAERLPDLLTVEEAARLARVGRTKAYAMAREWRNTGGRSGLPVIDFGHILRVPRRALEEMIGAELTADTTLGADPVKANSEGGDRECGPAEDAPAASQAEPNAAHAIRRPLSSRRRQRRKNATRNQLDLFDSTD